MFFNNNLEVLPPGQDTPGKNHDIKMIGRILFGGELTPWMKRIYIEQKLFSSIKLRIF